MRLDGKVALVSGGARGIGAAVARLFAREGAKVAIADLLDDLGPGVAADIVDSGGEAVFIKFDATQEEHWNRAVASTVKRFGNLNILVNSVGIYRRSDIEQTSADEWDLVMKVNVRSAFLGSKAVVSALKAAGGGSIVNLSSVAGLIGGPYSTAYNASKGAVRLLSKSIALQYAKDGIRCNSVHPAPIETHMLELVFPDEQSRRERLAEIPLGRFGTPEEVAYAVLFLASDESAYVTGSELVIDGGLTAR